MSKTNYNWTSAHPRFVANLSGNGGCDIVGMGADGVWSSRNGAGSGFGEPAFQVVAFEANAGWRNGDHPRFAVDLTGDGRADLLGFGDDGAWVALGNGDGGFQAARFVLDELGFGKGWSAQYPRFVADLAGQRRPDIVGFGMDGIWVARGNGDGSFQPAALVSSDFAANSGWRAGKHPRFLADLTGSGRADIVAFGDDGAWCALGNGEGSFQPARFVLNNLGFNQGWRVESHTRLLADLTGDGRADLVGFGNDGVWVALGNGDGSFQPAKFVLAEFGFNKGWRPNKHPRFLADLTGDGRADIVGFGDAGVWVALGNGDGSFKPARLVLDDLGFSSGWRVQDHPRLLADMHGDGKLDIVGFGNDGVWVARGKGDGTFDNAAFVLADFGRRSNHDTIVRKEVVNDHRHQGRIKHLFVLMLENRSYDHLLGFAEISGTDAATGAPTSADGLTGKEFNTYHGVKYPVVKGAPDVTVAPRHEFGDALEQLCGRYAQHPNGGPYPEVSNTGFVSSLAHGYPKRPGDVMRCFDPDDLPILTRLAREFAVCDRWFCSMPGPTEPNRYFLHGATSNEYDESPPTWKIVESSTDHFGGIDFKGGNIFDALHKAGVKTRIYGGDNFPVVGQLEGVSNTFDVHDFPDLARDLQDPDFDYGFIHIEPKYFDAFGELLDHDFGNGNSQHPSGGVAAGERLIKATYEAIRNSPHWESSMLIITYDEHGGFYDHVVPGPAARTGSKGSVHGFMFDQLGPRVPAVVVSPFTAKATIEHRLLEHCSVVKTACDLFGVPRLRHARDLGGVCGLLHLAQLPQARTDTPAILPAVVVSTRLSAGREDPRRGGAIGDTVDQRSPRANAEQLDPRQDPPDTLIAMTVRVAAVRELAREPQRKPEIAARVARIRTTGDAAAYIREVDAKLKASRGRGRPAEGATAGGGRARSPG
jgi:phospholipase C